MPGNAVSDFCADVDRAVRTSGLSVPHLVRRLGLDQRRVDDMLAGAVGAPPDWETLVAPLLHACGADPAELELWRRHHAMMLRENGTGMPRENGTGPGADAGPGRQRVAASGCEDGDTGAGSSP
ncbi:hypothetical protein [Actinoplanes sp. NPDC051494]|uniref:hypothetical protein n=1 Tax=Actinoplanes sp. NPDC051494 TaxID=3363907 RepID=UPI0037B55ED0